MPLLSALRRTADVHKPPIDSGAGHPARPPAPTSSSSKPAGQCTSQAPHHLHRTLQIYLESGPADGAVHSVATVAGLAIAVPCAEAEADAPGVRASAFRHSSTELSRRAARLGGVMEESLVEHGLGHPHAFYATGEADDVVVVDPMHTPITVAHWSDTHPSTRKRARSALNSTENSPIAQRPPAPPVTEDSTSPVRPHFPFTPSTSASASASRGSDDGGAAFRSHRSRSLLLPTPLRPDGVTPSRLGSECTHPKAACRESDAPLVQAALPAARLFFTQKTLCSHPRFFMPREVSDYLISLLQPDASAAVAPFWLAAFAHQLPDAPHTRMSIRFPCWVPPLRDSCQIIFAVHQAALKLVTCILRADRDYNAASTPPPPTSLQAFVSFSAPLFTAEMEEQMLQVFLHSCTSTNSDSPLSRLRIADLQRFPSSPSLFAVLCAEEHATEERCRSLGSELEEIPSSPARLRKRDRDGMEEPEHHATLQSLRKRQEALRVAKAKYLRCAEAVVFPLRSAAVPDPRPGLLPEELPFLALPPSTAQCKADTEAAQVNYASAADAPASLLDLIHYFALVWLQGLAPDVYDRIQEQYCSSCLGLEVPPSGRMTWWWGAVLPWTSRMSRWRLWWNRQPGQVPRQRQALASLRGGRMKVSLLHHPQLAEEGVLPTAQSLARLREDSFNLFSTLTIPLSASVAHTTTQLLMSFLLEGSGVRGYQSSHAPPTDAHPAFTAFGDFVFLLRWMPTVVKDLLWPNEVQHLWEMCLTRLPKDPSHSLAGDAVSLLQMRGFRFVSAVLIWISCTHSRSNAGGLGVNTWKESLLSFFAAHEVDLSAHPHLSSATGTPSASVCLVAMAYFSRVWLTLEKTRAAVLREKHRRRKDSRRQPGRPSGRPERTHACSSAVSSVAPSLSVGTLAAVDASLFRDSTEEDEEFPYEDFFCQTASADALHHHDLQHLRGVVLQLIGDLEQKVGAGERPSPRHCLERGMATQFLWIQSMQQQLSTTSLQFRGVSPLRCPLYGEDAWLRGYAHTDAERATFDHEDDSNIQNILQRTAFGAMEDAELDGSSDTGITLQCSLEDSKSFSESEKSSQKPEEVCLRTLQNLEEERRH